jgi:hypothetical protein
MVSGRGKANKLGEEPDTTPVLLPTILTRNPQLPSQGRNQKAALIRLSSVAFLTADTSSVSVTSTATTAPKFRNKDLGYGDVRIGLTHKREMSLGEGEVTTSQFCLGEQGAIIDLSGGRYHRNTPAN